MLSSDIRVRGSPKAIAPYPRYRLSTRRTHGFGAEGRRPKRARLIVADVRNPLADR